MTKIYIDENFAHQLANGLDVFQQHLNRKEQLKVQVLSIKEEFGQGALDEKWIPIAGKEMQLSLLKIYEFKLQGIKTNYIKNMALGYSFLSLHRMVIPFGKW